MDDQVLLGMPSMRSYRQRCGTAHALDLVGERWSLLVVRELLLGPKRFTDLRTGLPGASPNVLSQRLRELESAGVVAHRRLPPPTAASIYELTEWGAELEPVVLTLGRWGLRSPHLDRSADVSADALALALRTFGQPDPSWSATFQIRIQPMVFAVVARNGAIAVTHGEPNRPQATLTASTATFAALMDGADPSDTDAEATGDLVALHRLFASVHTPDQAAAT